MSPRLVTSTEIEAANVDEDISDTQRLNTLWPLDQVDPKKAKFPCCIVWTPLPIVSWLAPYIGHVGIGREDGKVLDFAGSNFVNVDNFAYGAVARYLQLDREQVQFFFSNLCLGSISGLGYQLQCTLKCNCAFYSDFCITPPSVTNFL